MAGIYEIKTGKANPGIVLQVAAQWELLRNGTADGLLFNADKHIFTIESTGERIPSITQVLKAEGLSPDYSGVDPWYALRGTYTHKATQLHDNDNLEENTIDPEIAPYLAAYRKFRSEWSREIIGIECQLWSPTYKYAGIIDRTMAGNKCYILYLRKDGTYRFPEVKNLRGSLNVFLSALNILNWKLENLKGDTNE